MIATYTGRLLDPCNVRHEDIDIADIAHALALCNRFAGHTQVPFSVAQHSVYVSWLSDDPLQGLLHDASEAYLGDVTRSLKHSEAMTRYRMIEAELQCRIYEKFGCTPVMHPSTHRADDLMCRAEFDLGWGERASTIRAEWPDLGPLTPNERMHLRGLTAWSWTHAEMMFLREFARLTGSHA